MSTEIPSTDLQLSQSERLLLTVLLIFRPPNKSTLQRYMRALDVRATPTRALDASLQTQWMERLQADGWWRRGELWAEVCQERWGYLLHELAQDPACLRPLNGPNRHIHSYDRPVTLPLWLALLSGQTEEVRQLLASRSHRTRLAEQPCHLLLHEPGQAVLGRMPRELRELLLADYLNELVSAPGLLLLMQSHSAQGHEVSYVAEQAAAMTLACQWLQEGLTPESPLLPLLREQLVWRGDWALLGQLPEQQRQLGDGVQALLQGRAQQALEILQTPAGKLPSKRPLKLPLEQFLCWGLACIAQQDAASLTALQQALQQQKRSSDDSGLTAIGLLLAQLQGQAGGARLPEFHNLSGLDGVVCALVVFWLQTNPVPEGKWPQRLQVLREQLLARQYHWLVAELDVLLARQFELPPLLDGWHAAAGLTPLIELYRPLEPWQNTLNALAALRPAPAGQPVAAEADCRLAWLIGLQRDGSVQIEPREQKRNARGVWGKGRTPALRRLQLEMNELDWLTEQDRRAISHIRHNWDYYGYDRYELQDAALLQLIGHPLLFRLDAPDTRIDLVAAQVSLHLQEQQDAVLLQLVPAGIDADSDFHLCWETPTRLQLYLIPPTLQQMARLLGDGLRVPQRARAQLLETVGNIAPLLPIHADLPELAEQIDSVPADARLYAHLLPLDEGLRLQLLVRPLPGGSWLRPGQGAESVLGDSEGRPVQARRDLAQERQTLEQVLAACPALSDAEYDGHEWQLASAQAALQMLGELQALEGGQLTCIWPEGERMRIRARSHTGNLQLRLRQSGDWFALDGELQLDEGHVLQLQKLLDLLRASPGRFVRLDERDWLALDGRLRRQLEDLARLAEHSDASGLRFSPLTAPLLGELADEAGSFAADAAWEQQRARLASLRDFHPQLPATLQTPLRDYQQDGFVWLARLAQWGVGACLADDMGLGKTVQTLALLLARAHQGPQLVVAPTSVSLNWLSEARRFAPTLRLRSYRDERTLDALGPQDLLVVSYGLLLQDAEAFAAQHWSTLVLDEAQAIKNAASKRAKACFALQADFRLVATGTPVENHLGELWSLFHFLNPGLLGSQERFAQRFAGPIERGDQAARRALKTLIQPFILRRLKSQVLDELPPRTEITCRVPLSADEAHLYEALRRQALEQLAQAEDGRQPLQVLAELTRLRRFCCHPTLVLPDCGLAGSKLEAFGGIVEELRENQHRALVFSQFVDHLAIVRNWLDGQGIRYQYLDGATPAKARQASVEAFQRGEGEVFLISLKAGGSGLNLTAADYVIHLDPWWNPAVEDQASDRAHRIGQQRPVTIYRLVTENTIEERILALHAEKRDLADSLLEGGEVSARLDAEALLALLRAG